MNQAILLESNADNIDFMIHGIFSIKVFGQEVWITTSHACILIVMALMVIFAIVANRKLKKAKEVPDGFQNIIELIVEMLDNMVEGTMGKWAKHQSAKDIWTGMCSPLPPWLPIWAPINIISEIAIPISLSLRLFANVLSGTVIMALVYGLLRFIAIAWPSVLHVYFDLFSGAIQTYVFCMLTMTYVTQACETDE